MTAVFILSRTGIIKLFWPPVIRNTGLIIVGYSIGLTFTKDTLITSLAPSGADQMGIIGHELEADIAMITGYQLFRILFIFFAVPPLLKWILGLSIRQKEKNSAS